MKIESKYRQYAKLKEVIKDAQAKLRRLEIDLIDELDETPEKKLQTDYAIFNLCGYKKYKYSEDLVTREKEHKKALLIEKKKEVIDGIAEKIEDGVILRCTLTTKSK